VILAVAALVLATGAFVAGAIVASDSPERDAAARFAGAWQRQDYAAMYQELTPASASRYPLADFRDSYQRAAATATISMVETGDPTGPESFNGRDVVEVPVRVQTNAFGEVVGAVDLDAVGGQIEWDPHLVFPGLEQGERLERRTRAPERAAIFANDGTALAEGGGGSRTSALGRAAINVVGELGAADESEAARLERLGFPPGTLAGTSGLEKAFNARLTGKPGGELLAVGGGAPRALARAEPQPSKAIRTTIDPTLQAATVNALGDQFGGIAVLDARKGSVLALAGIAFSALQPPGSSFKVVTSVAALEGGHATPEDEYPFESSNTVVGREIRNAGDALCGGTLTQAFASSCNTVFAPLGVEVGGPELLDAAERFGFNSPPTLFDERATRIIDPPTSVVPDPIGDDVAVGVSAIGQGQVQATPLQMASVAQTIAAGGVRSPTSIVKEKALRADVPPEQAVSSEVAATLREMMIEVVESGTGGAAALSTFQVAGKTGTAELRPKDEPPPQEGLPLEPEPDTEPAAADGELPPEDEPPPQEEDAWFIAFAPAKRPQVAIAVMIVNAEGGGGAVAAPIARDVLAAALEPSSAPIVEPVGEPTAG
jgi:cell division protein FtsI/penicillin-binding protein 2